MTSSLPCQRCEEHLDDYLDGELSPELHHAVEVHLDGCARCGTRHQALQNLLGLATQLPAKTAPHRWPEIEGQLAPRHPNLVAPGHRSRGWLPVALAAAVLLVATVALTRTETAPQEEVLAQRDSDRAFDEAIGILEAALEDKALSPELRTLIDRNLALIDVAIEESLSALETHPDSPFLKERLTQLRTQKVAVLRQLLHS